MAPDRDLTVDALSEATALYIAGKIDGAVGLLARELDRIGDDPVKRFYLELQRAGWLREGGYPEASAAALDAAADDLDRMPRAEHGSEWSMLKMEQALVARQRGDFRAAEVLLDEAAQLAEHSRARDLMLTDILANQAAVYIDEARLGEARDALTAALELDRRTGNVRGESNDLNMFGLVHKQLGDAETARVYLEQAFEVGRRHGLVREATNAMVNLATLMDDAGDHAAAEDLFRRAGELLAEGGDKSSLACSIANQGVAASQAGDLDRAISFFERSYERHMASGNPLHGVHDQLNLSTTENGRGRPREALAHAEQALTTAREHGLVHLLWAAEFAVASSQVAVAAQRAEEQTDTTDSRGLIDALEEALAGYRRAAEVIELLRARVDRPEEREALLTGKESVYDHAISVCLGLGRPRDAFEMCERARMRSFLDVLGSSRIEHLEALDSNREADDDPLIARRERLVSRLLSRETPATAKPGLLDELRTVRAELVARRPALAAVTEADLPTPDEIRAAVPADASVLEFFHTGSSLVLFLLDSDGLKDCVTVTLEEPLEVLIQRFRDEIEAADPELPTGNLLYAALIRPVMRMLAKTARLIVVPHRSLHYLPFSALWFVPGGDDAPPRQYLKTRFYLTTVPSSSYLPQLARQAENSPREHAVVVGDPTGDLEGAQREAQRVGRRLGVTPVLGSNATRAVVLRAGAPRVLHVACHGHYHDEDPLLSGLELADGVLTVEDLLNAGPAPALLVLSGCLTGMSLVRPGDELIGLAQAALRGGTRSVVATLWETFDESSALFFDRFYEALGEGETVGSAMAWAREMVARAPEGFEQPVDWAPFVLIGDPDLTVVAPDQTFTKIFSRALELSHAGNTAEAKRALLDVAERGSTLAPAALYTLGGLCFDEGDLPGAVAAYERVVESGDPRWVGLALNDMGIMRFQRGDPAGARASYERAIGTGYPEAVAKASTNLATLLAQAGDVAGARAAYQRAIDTGNPEVAPSAALRLSMFLIETGDVPGARSALRTAVDSGDADVVPVAAYNLGVLLTNHGLIEEAMEAYAVAARGGHAELASRAAVAMRKLSRRRGRRAGRRGTGPA